MDNDLMARRLRPPSEPIKSKMLPAATQPEQSDSTPQREIPPAPSTEEAVSWTPAPPQPETWDALARDAVPWDRPADYVAQTDSASPDQPAWDRPSETDAFDSVPVDDRMSAVDPTSDLIEQLAMIDEDQPLAVWSAESVAPDPDDAYAPVLNDVSTPISRAWPEMNGHDAGRNDATVATDSFVMPPAAASAPVAETSPPDSALAEPMHVSPAVNGEWHESTDSEPGWSQPEATAAPQWAEPEGGYAPQMAEPEADSAPRWAESEADAVPQWAEPEPESVLEPEAGYAPVAEPEAVAESATQAEAVAEPEDEAAAWAEPEPETVPKAVPEAEAAAQVAEPEAVGESATQAEAVAEPEDEAAAWAELEADAVAETDPEPQAVAQPEAAAWAEPEAEPVAEAVPEPDTEPEVAAESEADSWAEFAAEAEAESDTEPQAVAQPEAEAAAQVAEPDAEATPLWPDHRSSQDDTEPAESPGQTSWVLPAVEPSGLVPGLGPTPPAELFGNGPVDFAFADIAHADPPEWHGSAEMEDTFAVMEPEAEPDPAPESAPSPAQDSAQQPEPARVEQPSAGWPVTPAALPFSTAPVPATARPFGMGEAGAADADRMAPRDPEFEPRGPMPPPAVEPAWMEPSTNAQFDDQTGWLDPTRPSQPQAWEQQPTPMETVPEPTAVPPWATAQAEPTAVPPWAPALAEPTAVPPWASIQPPAYPPGRAPAAGLHPVAPLTPGFAPLPVPFAAQTATPLQAPAPPWSQPSHSADPLAQFASPFAPALAVPATSPMNSAVPQVATVTAQEQSDLWFLSTEPGGVAADGKDAMEGREPSPILTGILTVGMAVLVIVLVLVFIQLMTSLLR